MREIHSTVKVVQTLDPIVVTAAQTGKTIDHSGFEAAEHLVTVGFRGDVLFEDRHFRLILETSDDATVWAPVTSDALVIGKTVDGSGVFELVDSLEKDRQVHRIAYVGEARYSRVRIGIVGTHTVGTPIGMLCLLGRPWVAPVS